MSPSRSRHGRETLDHAIRAVIVTNIPAPYRIPVYELLDDGVGIDLRVIYTAERESNRHWELPRSPVRSRTLKALVIRWRGRYIHLATGTVRALRSAAPEVIVTTGFNPPQLIAVAYAVLRGIPHVAQTDGTVASEARLTGLHRLVRRIVARHSSAFVAASTEGQRLQRGYGAAGAPSFLSPLGIDNRRFGEHPTVEKDVDLLFAGQLSEIKDPLFALEVARSAAQRLQRRLTVAFLGSGPLLDRLSRSAAAAATDLDVVIAGFQQQDALPDWYARSKVFLFPTHWDPWGLVANEAAAAGIPQIISPSAGAAGELIVDGESGFVLELDQDLWVERVVRLLTSDEQRGRLGAAAQRAADAYSYSAAAAGLRAAILCAADSGSSTAETIG